jgi:hypothetical protein
MNVPRRMIACYHANDAISRHKYNLYIDTILSRYVYKKNCICIDRKRETETEKERNKQTDRDPDVDENSTFSFFYHFCWCHLIRTTRMKKDGGNKIRRLLILYFFCIDPHVSLFFYFFPLLFVYLIFV